MKRVLLSSFFLFLLISACTDNSYISNPETQGAKSWLQIQKISPDQSLEKKYSYSAEIDGAVGGVLEFSKEKKKFSFDGTLTVPAGAYVGVQNIEATVNTKRAYIDFEPSPFEFEVSAVLNFDIQGIRISKKDADDIQFGYFDSNNNFVPVQYDEVVVDPENGLLSIHGAKINHFSRYGWTR
ncbi:MAG: hypothetical protein CO129_10680 [Ignavibacteriales bacterium CG_4_9_14_3_um_filter_34_10]|nr:MAG: hypothetical protein CO129_10680 [Ignavibacteriales bacterium CG_4_9_14_3_um_filter_34_10]